MKILYLAPGLVPILSTHPVIIPDVYNKKKKEVDNNNKPMNRFFIHVIEDNSISLDAELNGAIKPLMNITTGTFKWGHSYDHKTRCEAIRSRVVDSFATSAFIMGSKNGYPIVCTSKNTCNVVKLTTFNQKLSSKQLDIGFNMIQNEHQYKVSQGKIKEIEQSLDQLYKEKSSLHPRQFKMRENGLQGILAEIQEEIEKYDALKENPMVIEIQSFAEIPIALIKARIASGMTQKDLAEKLGMKEQQIQRYEANQYGSAGFHRLTEVAEALEVTLNSSLLTLRK
jgi:HTH-type transcriptional regulator / antitoxin HipB